MDGYTEYYKKQIREFYDTLNELFACEELDEWNRQHTEEFAKSEPNLDRRFIPMGQRNAVILRRDGYLSPSNADFARGYFE